MGTKSKGQPATNWGAIASGGECKSYRMAVVPPAGVLTYAVVNGHLMQWWENSRMPHFSVVLPVAEQPVAPPAEAAKPAALTPSLFLSAVQDGQERNVGPLPHLMVLAPVKLPQFQEVPQGANEHIHAWHRLGPRAGTSGRSKIRRPSPLTPRSQEKRPCTGPGPLRMRYKSLQSCSLAEQPDFAASFKLTPSGCMSAGQHAHWESRQACSDCTTVD